MINPAQKGDRIGTYRVDDLIARGGMASIFRGTNLENGAPVAIKIPHPEMESDVVFYSRFQREAEIGGKLDHPGVVKVFPVDDPERISMVMEWVEGRRLRDILDENGKLAPERAIRITANVCDALDYIHRQGIVHRDLKPDNIMVDADDNVKILDFGIARLDGARRLTFGKLSRSMGTPDYASPERVKGKRGDARSDIYSVGVMLYEMIAGRVPFADENPLVALNQRTVADPPLLSESDPEISPEIEEIVWRALERDPANRYPTACEFAADLRNPGRVAASDQIAAAHLVAARLKLAHAHAAAGAPMMHGMMHAAGTGAIEMPMPPKLSKFSWAYVLLALIPVVVFALLLLVARQR
jgi:eukaryotic-like serine/threonine-protein kinase